MEIDRPLTWREELARIVGGGVKAVFPAIGENHLESLFSLLGVETSRLQQFDELDDPSHRYLICASCSFSAY